MPVVHQGNPQGAAFGATALALPAPAKRGLRKPAAGAHKPVVDPAEYWRRFYHARTTVCMTKAEVDTILADPRGAPDSDDEEDIDEYKARASVGPDLAPVHGHTTPKS